MTRYWWHCRRCGFNTKNEPDEAWAEADRDWHLKKTCTDPEHRAEWRPYELSISHYSFREVR